MNFKRSMAVAALVAAGLTGCDSNGDISGIVIADLEGHWDASQLLFSPSSSTSTSNPISFTLAGGDLVVDIASNGSFEGVLTVPGAITGGDPLPLDVGGTMTVEEVDDEDMIVVDFDAATEGGFAAVGLPFADFDGPLTLSGNQITITNETMFDFDLGGPNEAEGAVMTMILVRTTT